MAQNTFPAFTNMIPTVEDIQLIVDSLRQEDRYRTTKDRIFNPGIVNQKDSYLSSGTKTNSLKIKPFVAYTSNGNRIEVSSTWDNLYAQGNVIQVTDENLVLENINIPVWNSFTNSYETLTSESTEQQVVLTTLGRGSILHGIKVRVNSLFRVTGADIDDDIYISIGTVSEPEKFLPKTLISDNDASTNLNVMNLMYSIDDASTTNIIATYYSNSINLNTLTSGGITINLCIANLSGFDNEDLSYTNGGYELNNSSIGSWQPNTTYHIVARYKESFSNYRQLNYTTIDGTNISTLSEPTRVTTDYSFFALRKTGSVIDYTTNNDVKLGEVITDASGNINAININGFNRSGDAFTEYLTLPGYRFVENIDASQIGDGTVTNTQFGYLNSLTSNVQTQLNLKAGLNIDNKFTGENTFETQIKGSIEKVNGFTAYATPTPGSLLVLDDNGKIPADSISEGTFSSIGNFYTVSSGVTTDGRADFLESNQTKDGVLIKATVDNPLVLNYPNGAVEKITQNRDIQGLAANGYYYLIKEQNGNFIFLPTSGGTMACIPTVSSGNTFPFGSESDIGTGTVEKSYQNSDGTTHLAFDGTINTGALMGKVTYTNYSGVETTSYLPSGGVATYIDIVFPESVTPTGFAACFRRNQYDVTPKSWIFEGSNDDGTTWTQLAASTTETWDIDQIKTFAIDGASAYTKFRFTFNMVDISLNNYMIGEETDNDGVTMPINCYYFQMYATNTDTSIKGNVVEGYKQPTGMSIGSYFLDISKKPYTGYKCTDVNTFTETNYVKLGFINVTGMSTDNIVITCYPFCYNTFTISDDSAISLNTPITFNHNLGVIPNIIQVKYICASDNNGYVSGEYISNIYSKDSVGTTSIGDSIDSTVTTVRLHPGSSGSMLYVKHKTTNLLSSISNGQWKAIIYCSRGW